MKSLAEAYREKYEDIELPEEDGCEEIQVYVPKSCTAKGTPGFGLGGRLAMDNLQISTVGDVDDGLIETFAKVRELDLTKNCICDWSQVQSILSVMPYLELLNVTMNPLSDDSFTEMLSQSTSMKSLILNGTNCSWTVVSKLLNSFPDLQELHLSINQYQKVGLPINFRHQTMSRLFMNDCNIDCWEEIRKLGQAFPNLESLTIINSNIRSLSNCEDFSEFEKLECLNIGQCCLSSWEDVDKFRKFPALDHLRISGVPFLEEVEAKPRRQQLIARLPGLKKLNGSRVTETEKEEAERAFIRLYLDSDNPPARYYELEKRYGKLDPLVHVDLTPNSTLNLLVRFKEKSKIMDVYLHQTVTEFKKHIQTFTGLPPSQQRLFYNEMFDGTIKDSTELRLPSKTLLSLNINEGDEFEVLEKRK